jgi:hypothetical protein
MLKEIKIASITIGFRHRKDKGDLTTLGESIRQEGLLQPIGVTERHELVFGERRLLAVRDILKKRTILARIVNVCSILAGEYHENEVRKDFTPSERVAIARAIEGESEGFGFAVVSRCRWRFGRFFCRFTFCFSFDSVTSVCHFWTGLHPLSSQASRSARRQRFRTPIFTGAGIPPALASR